MALNKRLAEFIASRKKHDSYWVESAKLDFSIQMEKRRKNAGLSYADLAKKIGTSAAYITKVFRGDANLTIESMVKLSRATGGKVDLRIIDENIVADPSIWFASNIYHLPAANHVMVGTETVVSSKLPEIYDDYQLQKVG